MYSHREGGIEINGLQLPSQPRLRNYYKCACHKKQASPSFLIIIIIVIFIPDLLLLHAELNINQIRTVALVTPNYRSYADTGMKTLQEAYNMTQGQWADTLWWQQANALGTTIDYSSLTHTTTYIANISATFKANQKGSFINKYYDDEGWWAITWLKAYDLTHAKVYLDTSKNLFRDMARGWDSTCGGGIWWSKDKAYKNAIANELFLALAVQLHEHVAGDTIGSGGGPNNTSYIDWAEKEWRWFRQSGMLNSSNLVNDGLDSACHNNGDNPWTYNQGVLLGALTDLYHITHNLSYLTQAEAIADANDRTNVDENGVLYELGCEPDNSCGYDGPQFKGIYMQNLYTLYQADHKQAYRNFIMANADAIWDNSRDTSNHLGLHWDGPFDQIQTDNQISAMDALNAAIDFSNLLMAANPGIQQQKYPAHFILSRTAYLDPKKRPLLQTLV